jgi:serine/threonine-protein kinase
VYVARAGTSEAPRTLVWVNRRGEELPISAPPRPYSSLRLSPDATRVALEIEDADNDIWVWDFGRETLTRVTTSPGLDESPIWTPDGQRVIFTSQAGGELGALFWQPADGSGVAERLTDSRAIQRASDVLSDGSGILFSEGDGVRLLTLDTERRVRPVLAPMRFGGDAVVSPDGRWLAYAVSADVASGRQVFVSSYADPAGNRTLVSKDGGGQPRWSAEGRELFFLGSDGMLMSVPVAAGETLRVGAPAPALPRVYFNGYGLSSRAGSYDVSRDAQRFLMLKQVASAGQPAEAATVVVVKNWAEELRRLVPSNGR